MAKEVKEIFLLFNAQEEFQGIYKSQREACQQVEKDEMDGAVILRCVEACTSYYPEDPAPEMANTPLNRLWD
jgi:hypothetical protein